jgi:Flp pilus assembly pilin Flp
MRTLVRAWQKRITKFVHGEQGTTTAEYGLVMAFIVLAALGTITILGLAIDGWFIELTSHFNVAMGGIP